MRAVPPELQARLDSRATTLCRCWRVRRRDGLDLGFTDHDEDVVFEGLTFAAGSGLDASAVQAANGLSVDNGQARGALTSAAIDEDSIRAGLFDAADVWHWLVDWTRPDLRVLLFRGTLGEIRRADGAFEVELRGLAEALNVPVGRSLLRTCDRVLGDHACGVNVDAPRFSTEGVVAAVVSATTVAVVGADDFEPHWFARGSLIWIDGANREIRQAVKSDTRDGARRVLELWQEPGRPIESGDRCRLVAGCDKRAETCRDKFSNFMNFRGFPHIPGEDWVTAYPKDGEAHDGRSRYR